MSAGVFILAKELKNKLEGAIIEKNTPTFFRGSTSAESNFDKADKPLARESVNKGNDESEKTKTQLKPNDSYNSNGYEYKTDDKGRITTVEGNLRLEKAERSEYSQKLAGGESRKSNDDGGHLIASQFGGSGKLDNLVPMNSNINRAGGKWYSMESTWEKALSEGKSVNVKIKAEYKGESLRPDSFIVKYKIEGEGTKIVRVKNQQGG